MAQQLEAIAAFAEDSASALRTHQWFTAACNSGSRRWDNSKSLQAPEQMWSTLTHADTKQTNKIIHI